MKGRMALSGATAPSVLFDFDTSFPGRRPESPFGILKDSNGIECLNALSSRPVWLFPVGAESSPKSGRWAFAGSRERAFYHFAGVRGQVRQP